MSKQIKLPNEITVKFIDDSIEVIADGVPFPFEITEFFISYYPDSGADFGISAGSSMKKRSTDIPKNTSILQPSNDVHSPSAMGILPIEDDSAQNLTTSQIAKMNKISPIRKKQIVMKADVDEYDDVCFLTVQSDTKPYTDVVTANNIEDIVDILIKDLCDKEQEAFEDYMETGIDTKFVCIQQPQLVFEDDTVYIEERFRVYQR